MMLERGGYAETWSGGVVSHTERSAFMETATVGEVTALLCQMNTCIPSHNLDSSLNISPILCVISYLVC